jgi:hypothetical protein
VVLSSPDRAALSANWPASAIMETSRNHFILPRLYPKRTPIFRLNLGSTSLLPEVRVRRRPKVGRVAEDSANRTRYAR